MPFVRFSLVFASLALALAASPWARAETYRWVDQQGRVHYGDVLPSGAVGAGASKMDKEGRVRGRVQPTPSAERRASLASTAEREAQRRYDNSLLSTYLDVEEIDLARERALGLERARLNGMQERLGAVRSRLGSLSAEAEGYRRAGMAVPMPVMQMKREAEIELITLSDQVLQTNQAVESIWARYEAAKDRFRQIKANGD